MKLAILVFVFGIIGASMLSPFSMAHMNEEMGGCVATVLGPLPCDSMEGMLGHFAALQFISRTALPLIVVALIVFFAFVFARIACAISRRGIVALRRYFAVVHILTSRHIGGALYWQSLTQHSPTLA